MKIIKNAVNTFLLLSLMIGSAEANNTSYVLAARQAALFKTQDRISDMVANVETTAFKAEKDVYSEYDKRMADGRRVSFGVIKTTERNTDQASFIVTKRQLDIAIDGQGYFMVDTPRGYRFTRAGNLKISADGVLVTKDGFPLIGGGGGQVEFAPEDVNVTIRENGLVSVGLEERGQISVYVFDDEKALIKEGNALYRTDQTPVISEESKVVQGMLEASNVNSVTAMTDLIAVSRDIETVKKMQEDWHGLQLNMIRSVAKE